MNPFMGSLLLLGVHELGLRFANGARTAFLRGDKIPGSLLNSSQQTMPLEDGVLHPFFGGLRKQSAAIYVYNPESPQLNRSKIATLDSTHGLTTIDDNELTAGEVAMFDRSGKIRKELVDIVQNELTQGNKILQRQVGKEILIVRTAEMRFQQFRFFIWSPELCLLRGELEAFTNPLTHVLQCKSLSEKSPPAQEQFKLEKGLVPGIAFGLEMELTARDSTEVVQHYPNGTIMGWDTGAASFEYNEVDRRTRQQALIDCYQRVASEDEELNGSFVIIEDKSVRSINEFSHCRVSCKEAAAVMTDIYASGMTPTEIEDAIMQNRFTKRDIKVQVSEMVTQYYRKHLDASELNGIGFELIANGPLYPNHGAEAKTIKMLRALRSMGVQSNPSGSIHVHLNAFAEEVAQRAGGSTITFLGFTSVYLAWTKYQVAIDSMMPVTRRVRPYAKMVFADAPEYVRQFKNVYSDVMKLRQSGQKDWFGSEASQKASALHRYTFHGPTKHNTVEVRQSTASYTEEYVLRWVQFLQGFMAYWSTNHELIERYVNADFGSEVGHTKLKMDAQTADLEELFQRLSQAGFVEDDSYSYFMRRIQSFQCSSEVDDSIQWGVVDYGTRPSPSSTVFSVLQSGDATHDDAGSAI